MLTIFKYPIQITDEQEIFLPDKANILTVQTQYGQPHIWALCNPKEVPMSRTLFICGTGNPIDSIADKKYIGTFQMDNGLFVWHLFEKII